MPDTGARWPWRTITAAVLVAVLALGCWWALPRSGRDTDAASAVATMTGLADRLRTDPAAASGRLPAGVSTYYPAAGLGATELRGWLYRPLPDGRCVVVAVVAGRAWLAAADPAGFTVTSPRIQRGCPGDRVAGSR